MAEIGALSLRIQEQGGQAVLEKLSAIDTAAKTTGQTVETTAAVLRHLGIGAKVVGGQIQVAAGQLEQATTIAGKFGQASAVVTATVTQQAAATKTATAATQQATAATAQAVPAQQAQAQATTATAQATQAQATASQRAAAATQRQGATAQRATQQQQILTATTNRQTQATTALGGTLVKADGQLTTFGKRGLTALNGLAFAFSQMANTGELSLRAVSGQLTGVLALLGKAGAVGAIAATVGLSIFDVLRASQKRAIDQMALDRATSIRNALVQQKAFLDLNETNQKFAYEQGLRSLRDFYAERSQIIQDRTRAEITAREQQAAALEAEAAARLKFVQVAGKDLPDALRGETLKQADELRAQAKILRAEAKAAADQGLAEQTRNTGERIAAEKSLADQVRQFEAQRLDAQGKTHQARLIAIQVEAQTFEKALAQQGVAEDQRAARVAAFTTAMQQQANLAQAQVDLARLQTDLDTQRTRIQNDLAAGRITELEAAQATADVENSALPTLREMVERALQFAAALGDDGALGALRQLKAELEALGRNALVDEVIQRGTSARAGASVRAAVQKMLDDAARPGFKVTSQVRVEWDFLLDSAEAVDQQFQNLFPNIANVLGDTLGAAFSDGIGAAGDVLLRGLGGIMQQMGQALVTYGLAMLNLLPALSNPFTSGAAAVAVGGILIALGGLLGGLATGKGSGGGGGARATAASGTDSISISVADRRLLPPSAQPRNMTASAAANPVTINLHTVNPADPHTQKLIARAAREGFGRGY